nr:reverse transcriptase domain-containing protein [Tanacetum cinerariifolium]
MVAIDGAGFDRSYMADDEVPTNMALMAFLDYKCMQTRSSSRLVSNHSSNPTLSTNSNPKGRNRRCSKQRIEEFILEELSTPIVMMSDQHTMAQLLQALTEGYEDAIVVPSITTDNFELKHGLLTLVQNKIKFGHDKEDPHAHIRYFNKITSTLKFPDVPNTSRFIDSIAGGNFLDKMPRECLTIIERKSKVRYSHNKPLVAKVSTNTSTSSISPDVAELKDMVKALLLDKKSQNQAPATVKAAEESCVTCGGGHSYRNCLATDGNVYRDNIQEFVSQASTVNYNQGNTSYRPPMMSNQIRPPGFPPVPNNQNVQLNQRNNQNCFNQNQNRGNNFNHGPVYQPPVFQPPTYQAPAYQAPAPQTQVNSSTIEHVASPVSALRPNLRPSIPYPSRLQDQKLHDKANDQREKFFQIFKDLNFNISFADALILMPNFRPYIKSLLTNKDKLCELGKTPLNEHYSAVLLKKFPEKLGDPGKFLIPCDFPGKAECLALADLKLADRLISRSVGVAEDVYVKVGTFHFLADFVVVDFDADPREPLILGRSFLKTGRALIDVFEGELILCVGKEKVLGFSDVIASGNPTPYYDLIVSTTSPTLTPFGNSDFLLEEVDAFLALKDDPISPKVNQSYLDSKGEILLLEAFLN